VQGDVDGIEDDKQRALGTSHTTPGEEQCRQPRHADEVRPVHRAAHSDAGDFARWGRLGGLETFALYGPGWFVLLARRRWEKITAAQLEEAFSVIRTGRS
jgi:hypothetical protein